jgi:hypothetical protein
VLEALRIESPSRPVLSIDALDRLRAKVAGAIAAAPR